MGAIIIPRLATLYEEFSASKQHNLPGAPVASATAARLQFGSSLVGGSASGTFLGMNAASGYAGDFAHVQLDGVSRWRLAASGLVTQTFRDAATNSVSRIATLGHNSSETPAAGFGSEVRFQLATDTTADQDAAGLIASWATATHASRRGRLALTVWDNTAARTALQLDTDGTVAYVALPGAPPASATLAKLLLGSVGALVGGSASGTHYGANAGSSFAGHLMNLQHNGTSRFIVNSATGWVSCPHTGTDSERFGNGSDASGSESAAFGSLAAATGLNTVAFGRNAQATASSACAFGRNSNAAASSSFALGTSATVGAGTGNNVAIGVSANATGGGNLALGASASTSGASNAVALGSSASAGAASGIAIGTTASAGHTACLAIGRASASTAANQLVIGSTTAPITDAYIGRGVTAVAPSALALNATGGSGTNIAGANLSLAGGKGTGNAAGGSVKLQTSDVGASGTTLQTLRDRLVLTNTGVYQLWGMSSTTARQIAQMEAAFSTATDASRIGDLILSVLDSAGTREFLRGRATGSTALLLIPDTVNVELATGTGTKWGTSASQLQSWWNATPTTQGSAWAATNVTTDRTFDADSTDTNELADIVGTLVQELQTKGLLAA